MKIRRMLAIATVVALAAVIGTSSATAQSDGLRAQIPFEFRAAGELFPAGTYVLTRANASTLRLEDAKGRGVFIAAGPSSVKMSENSWYVFHRYGNQSFLAGGYWSGSSTSLSIPASRAEREVAKIAQGETPIRVAAR